MNFVSCFIYTNNNQQLLEFLKQAIKTNYIIVDGGAGFYFEPAAIEKDSNKSYLAGLFTDALSVTNINLTEDIICNTLTGDDQNMFWTDTVDFFTLYDTKKGYYYNYRFMSQHIIKTVQEYLTWDKYHKTLVNR